MGNWGSVTVKAKALLLPAALGVGLPLVGLGCGKRQEPPSVSVAQYDRQAQTLPAPSNVVTDNGRYSFSLIQSNWNSYAATMIAANGMPYMERGVDRTTSEAVSYTLLQSVILGDYNTFDKTLGWAQKNMQRSDHLFGWEWRDGGFTQYGKDSASDADQDIAAALIIAWRNTGNAAYKNAAGQILDSIWQNDVVKLQNGKLLLTAGDKQALYLKDAAGNRAYGVNPSYFRPSYYTKLFREFDPAHPWEQLAPTAYEYTEKAADATMRGPRLGCTEIDAAEIRGTKNLCPDFIAVRPNGEITDHTWNASQDFCYGGDSGRIPYWMSLQHMVDPQDRFTNRFVSEQSGTSQDAGPLAFIKSQIYCGEGLLSGYQINGEPMCDIKGLQQGQKWPWKPRLWSYAVAYSYLNAAGEIQAANAALAIIDTKHPYADGFWQESDPCDKNAFYYGQNWMRLALLAGRFAEMISTGKTQPVNITPAAASSPAVKITPLSGLICSEFNGASGTVSGNNATFRGTGFDQGMVLYEGEYISGALTFTYKGNGTFKVLLIKTVDGQDGQTEEATLTAVPGEKTITLPVRGVNKVNIMADGAGVDVKLSGISIKSYE